MNKQGLGILAASTLLAFGCSDKQSPTGPAVEISRLLVHVTLSPLDPPTGAKHAALATFRVVARERAVALEEVKAYAYWGKGRIAVTGFTPVRLAASQSTVFDVILSSTEDIPCEDELLVEVVFDDGQGKSSGGGWYGCSRTETWLF